MINYCGTCYKKTHVKPCHLPEMGGCEDYFCAKCRRDLATVTTVEVLKVRYDDI